LSIYLTVAIHISYFSFVDIIIKMSKLILSYLFKTNLASFRSAIINDDTDRICRTLDIERDFLNKNIDGEGNTALLLAIDQPNKITFQTPLGFIASKVYEDYNSYKAQRTLEMAKILLDHGAYVDKPSPRNYKDENNKDYSGKETPLMTAVRKRNLPIVKLFIERKANVNYVERQSQIRA
jgi:ankyrin repeat protein